MACGLDRDGPGRPAVNPGRVLLGVVGAAAGGFAFLLAVVFGGGAMQIKAAEQGEVGTVGAGQQLKPGAVPAEYEPLINQAAHTCPEITAPLLAAQIQQESGWDPHATSPVGATGIAQFMPATWASSGADGDGDGAANPNDPDDAIAAQARYMCEQVAQVRNTGIPGDVVDLALASYNAGLGAVRDYASIPPYPETQQYVQRIRDLAAQLAQPAPDMGGSGWVTPAGGRCSSGFGSRWGEFHKGQDLAAGTGTPIVAASAGSVIASGPASGYGLWVKIAHADVVTIYGHNNANLVAVGEQVQAGQPIAEIGSRGQSTGPHLHYQVERDGQAVDPVSFHQQQGAPPLCGEPGSLR